MKTRSCLTQTTTPAIALRLFRQTPAKERGRGWRASEERRAGGGGGGLRLGGPQAAGDGGSAFVEDSLPSLEDTPGNFFLSTVNLRKSPFQSRYAKVPSDEER
jgi:hypothetical protein